jgi:hypothetical protein
MGLGSGIRDPGSGIRKKPIPDPGCSGQKGTGSRIRILNTAPNPSKCNHFKSNYCLLVSCVVCIIVSVIDVIINLSILFSINILCISREIKATDCDRCEL